VRFVLADRFAKVRTHPAGPAARREATSVLSALERLEEPSAEDVALVVDDAFVWVGLGFAKRARALVDRWLQAGVREPGLRRAAAIYTVAIAPPAAAGKLRAIADDPIAAAAGVANHVFRGELRAAIEMCKARGWFLDQPQAVSGVAYGVWAQAMLDDFDGALAVLATWRHRHPVLEPAQEHALLAAEARVESIRHHHARERMLLEEALAVCSDAGLGLERTYLEASYAIALVRAGELAAAKRIVKQWKAAVDSAQTLEVYRDVARCELALLSGDARAADAAAKRVLAYADSSGNVIYGCLARFHRVLAATRATLPALLDDYGRIAAQLQIQLHLRRHRLLEELPRDTKLVVRTRRRKRSEPLLRLFYPALTDLSSDLCWDRVQGTLYLSGDGPYSLAEHPILRRVLETLLATSDFALPIATLFERVWDMSYEPLRHEGKCHVALHRLRALLGGWRSGADRLVQVRDGTVRIADDATVCVIELQRNLEERADADSLAERVAAHLAVAGEASPAELASRIGVSRSALLLVLRQLSAAGRVERVGRARAIRYRAR
jgi:hypothetical protein